MTISSTRPRVYLTDFEVAVEFPLECPLSEQVCTGLTINGSVPVEKYCRHHAPEFVSHKPYNPFKLDVWQVGVSFSLAQFKVRDSFRAFEIIHRFVRSRQPFPQSTIF